MTDRTVSSDERLKRFENGQRIEVVEPGHELEGVSGTVVRLRMADNGAWVKMDVRPSRVDWPHPKDDARASNYVLYPDECREEIV